MKKDLNICHVITRMIVGGAQENTLLTCQRQLENGNRVTLVTGPTDGPEGKLLRQQNVEGLEIIEIPSLIRELNPLCDYKAYRELRRCFREQNFDVVHTHSSKAGVVARAAGWAEKVPLVVHTVHGQAFHPYQAAWKNWIYIKAEKFAAKRCHHIYAVAQAMIDQCVAAGVAPAEKYDVVYSGMDMDAFINAQPEAELRESLGIPADAPVIGKIARLFELKGHDYLIEAAEKIVKEFPEVRFLLVGDGELMESLKADIAARGMTKNFVFTGLVPPHEVCRYTALMDMLAHLSLREGLPRTVVQALASGIPAVGFSLDGTPEVILDNETGFICPPEDVDAVAEALLRLLRDPALCKRLGDTGRELVRTRFSWQRMGDILEAEYRQKLEALQA